MIILLRFLCIGLSGAFLGSLTYAQAQATLPSTYVGSVAGAQDPARTRWLGYWHGRIGQFRDVDMKIVVQEISETGRATLAYSWATTTDGAISRLVAPIEGDEINVTMRRNEKLHLTMDLSGQKVKVEFVGVGAGPARTSNYWVKGDLERQPPPTAAEMDEVRNSVMQGNAAHEAVLVPASPLVPDPETPKELAQWVGLWHGWTGLHRWSDVKLLIDHIDGHVLDGTDVVSAQYVYQDKNRTQDRRLKLRRVDGAFVHKQKTGQMTFRMRPSGDAIEMTDAYVEDGVETGRYGVLYRVPLTQAAANPKTP